MNKFTSSDEFAAFLKKDHDTRFNAGVEAMFYNIWAHYRDLDYAFLRGKLTDLIKEWIEKERLNALNVTSSFISPDPLTRNMIEIEIVLTEISEQPSVVEVDEVTTALDPSIAYEVPVDEPSLSVTIFQPLINLEDEPMATDAEEEHGAAANPTAI